MLRLLFLLLVVIGALAISLAVIFGVGVARRASMNPQPAPAVANASGTQPATKAATIPSASAEPLPNPALPAVPPAPGVARVVPAVPQPGVVLPAPRQMVVLSPLTAYLRGDEIQLEREDPPAIGAWRRVNEYIEWKSGVIEPGWYRVEIVYACEDGSGGEFVLRVDKTKLVATTVGTGGWTNFRTAIVGRAELPGGKARIAIKPSDLPIGHALMRLREVRLVPIAEPAP